MSSPSCMAKTRRHFAARHTSQGRQQSYTPRFEETEADAVTANTLKRGYTLGLTAMPSQKPVLETKDIKDDLELNYQLSQNDISPYSSIGQVKLMREVSHTQPIQDLKDLNSP